jgi:outer membrane protein
MKTLLLPLLSFSLLINPATFAATNTTATNTVTVGTVVNQALRHSPSLKMKEEEVRTATAHRVQANAEGSLRVDARAQGLHFEGLENRPLGPGVTLPVIDDQYSAAIDATQPLFTGGRITARRRGARLDEAAARATEIATAADTILNTVNAYWQWSKAFYLAESLEDAVRRTGAQSLDVQRKQSAGLALDSDLLAAEVLLDRTRLQLADARHQTDTARITLGRRIGASLPPEASPSKPITPATPLIPLDDALALARTNRQELVALEREATAIEARVRAEQAGSSPQISLVARYEQGNPNTRDFPPTDEWKDDAFIGATASWSLFDGGLTRARTSEMRSRARLARLRLQDAQEGVQAQVEETLLSLRHSLSRVDTALHAEASARRNLKVTTDLWTNGLARHSELLDAQAKLTDATYQRITSEADAVLADTLHQYALGLLTQETFNAHH